MVIAMSKPKAVQIMLESRMFFDKLPNDQAGQLIKALLAFADCGEVPNFADELSPLGFAFSAISAQVKRSSEKYEEKCRKNAENAKRRNNESKQPNATASDCKQTQPIVNVNENVNVIRNVNENVIGNESVIQNEKVFGKESGEEGVGGTGGAGEEEKGKPISLNTSKSDLQRLADRLKEEKSS